MKVKVSHIFCSCIVAVLGSLSSIPASAQYENDLPAGEVKGQNLDLNLNDEKLAEHDLKSSKVKDSMHVHSISVPVSKPKSTEQSKPSATKEEDALSFNFLYYIIQRFKISDLIDD